VIERASISAPSGITTHKNHKPPAAPLAAQITNRTRAIASQDPQAVRRARGSLPGGAWIGPAILQALLNVLDFGMTMQEAVSAPRFSATTDAIDISNRIPRSVQRELQAMGYEAHFYEPAAGGHGYGKDHGEMAAFISLGYAFLRRAIGWQPE